MANKNFWLIFLLFTVLMIAFLTACGNPNAPKNLAKRTFDLRVEDERNPGNQIILDELNEIFYDKIYRLSDDDRAIYREEFNRLRDGLGNSSKITYIYEKGDIGPGGGIIFYYNEDGFIMTDTGETAHYLEVAHEDIDNLKWASPNFTDTDITGTEIDIGSGRNNTALILAIDSEAPAAKACVEFTINGKNDWFLPSRGEMDELRRSLDLRYIYWSSSQSSNQYAWFYDTGLRFISGRTKDSQYTVRPIRAF